MKKTDIFMKKGKFIDVLVQEFQEVAREYLFKEQSRIFEKLKSCKINAIASMLQDFL